MVEVKKLWMSYVQIFALLFVETFYNKNGPAVGTLPDQMKHRQTNDR
jgi:hypothetical protein